MVLSHVVPTGSWEVTAAFNFGRGALCYAPFYFVKNLFTFRSWKFVSDQENAL